MSVVNNPGPLKNRYARLRGHAGLVIDQSCPEKRRCIARSAARRQATEKIIGCLIVRKTGHSACSLGDAVFNIREVLIYLRTPSPACGESEARGAEPDLTFKETLIYSCTPLSRLRERGWGRGRREEAAYISAHSLSLSLSRKRGERSEGGGAGLYFLQNRLIRASLTESINQIFLSYETCRFNRSNLPVCS